MQITGSVPSEAAPLELSAKPAWRKARLPALTPATTAEDALAAIILGCVEHLRGNEACVLARAHEEGVHQMRVAVRRLRSCLSLYARFLPADQFTYLNGELKWLIGELGPARDWDVFVGEILRPVARRFSEDETRLVLLSQHVERHRDGAYARAQNAVRSQRYFGLVLLLASWAEGRGWRSTEVDNQAGSLGASALAIAHDLLHDIYEGLLNAGQDFEHLDEEARHRVRIQLKQLRYATEFFASLYAKRRLTPYLAAMKSLQDDLGSNNDVAVAKKLLKRVQKAAHGKERAQLAYAAGLIIGWNMHVGDTRSAELVRDWHQLVDRIPYWESIRTRLQHSVGSSPEAETADRADGEAEQSVPVAADGNAAAAEPASGSAAAEKPAPASTARASTRTRRLRPATSPG